MSDDFPPPEPPGPEPPGPPSAEPPACPRHPAEPATIDCARCGTLVCRRCVGDSPPEEPLCAECVARFGLHAVRRPGARIDVDTCVRIAWQTFLERWTLPVAAVLVLIGAQLAGAFLGVPFQLAAERLADKSLRLVALVMSFALQLVTYWVNVSLTLGLFIIWLRVLRRQPAELGHLFDGFRHGLAGALANLLYLLAVVGGLILLVVPGIVVAIGLSLWSPLMVDKGLGPLPALRASWELTRGSRLDLFFVLLVSVVFGIAGVLACCVGAIPAAALIFGLQAVAYVSLVYPGNHYLRR